MFLIASELIYIPMNSCENYQFSDEFTEELKLINLANFVIYWEQNLVTIHKAELLTL